MACRGRGKQRPVRRTLTALGLALSVSVLLASCSGSGETGGTNANSSSFTIEASTTTTLPTTTTTTLKVYGPNAFDATDAVLTDRVRSAGLRGGMVRLGRPDGSIIHESVVGSVSGETLLSVASSTKWLTAATFMTFVDQGIIGLDDDISQWLPEFTSNVPAITARQLLAHTSGVRDHPCQSGGSSLSGCVESIASSPRQFPAGSKFSYGNSDFLVIGRLVEVLGGADFATVVNQRLTGPLQMMATTWPGSPSMANAAFGVRVTVDDYGRFLQMVLNRGAVNGTRVLSVEAVDALISNQVSAYDTSGDFSVGITKIPRYGLGSWPDVVNEFGGTVVVSGNGGMGFYPWVDYATKTWGIIGVQDARGAQVAVPASQKVQIEARSALAK
jgi:CubicO group peptidase (beta-lactamase class C family)